MPFLISQACRFCSVGPDSSRAVDRPTPLSSHCHGDPGPHQKCVARGNPPLPLLAGLATDLRRSRQQLIAENVLLRQQLIVASRKVKRPAFRSHERGLLVLLAGLVPRWRNAVLLVKPETILRWHRERYRLFWRHKSRRPGKPRPRLSLDVVELIRHMARSNTTWGAEQIRGELLKLGIRVARRSRVSPGCHRDKRGNF